MITRLRSPLYFVLFLATTAVTWAQGTTFTYEGRLMDNSAPANGSYDLQFTLRDASTAGNQIGVTVATPATTVSNGLFVVPLEFGPGVFNGSNRWLEVAVRTNGAIPFITLSPRQAVTATPYAITAGAVTGPIDGSSIVNGSIGYAKLATGAAAANLNASGQSGVGSGGVVLSPSNNTALINAGYVKIGTMQESDTWQQRDNGIAPGARSTHTAVWTGSEMVLWGGTSGGRYDPVSDAWKSVNAGGAPSERIGQTAVWTGRELVIWGGILSGTTRDQAFDDGARYDPAANTWTPVSRSGCPSRRTAHTAVWTGSDMLVWGGEGDRSFNDTFSYIPGRVMFLYQRP